MNESLTDNSDPKAMVYTANAEGVKLMSKSITNIRVADDGTISFDFMGGGTVINDIIKFKDQSSKFKDIWFDLQGRRLPGRPQRKGLYIHNGQKECIRWFPFSPPKFLDEPSGKAERGGVRGGLNSLKLCRSLATYGTQEPPQTLPLPMGRKNRLKLNAQRPHVYVGLIQ